MKTGVKFITNPGITHDAEGFDTFSEEWTETIPATVRDTTNKENVTAMQCGFNIDKIFVVMAATYNGTGILQDESTGYIYDIERVYNAQDTKTVILECSRRKEGIIWPS